jgi:MFS family permease
MRFGFPQLHRDQWLVFSAFLLWGFGSGLWLQLQPLYIEQLGADPRQVGAALGIPGIAVLFLYIPMGLLADRQQRRKPFIVAAWSTGTLATLLIALAPDWRWVIPGLALYLFSSFSRPIVGAYIASTDRGGNLGKLFALLSVGWSVGSIVGPALGGWIAEAWGLRAVLFVATGLNLMSTVATMLLKEHPAPASAAGAAPKPGLAAIVGDRHFLWQMCVVLLIVFAFDLGTLLAPTYLQDVKGLNLAQIGQMGTVASVGMLLFMISMGQLAPERRLPLLLLQAAVAAALALLLFSPAQGGGLGLMAVIGLAYFFRGAVEAIWPTTRSRVALWVAPQALSLGFGVLDTASQIARTIAPFAAGYLYAQSPTLPLAAGLGALAATTLLTLTLPHRRPQALAEAQAAQG